MTKLKTAPAALPSVAEAAARAVSEREDALAVIEGDIASAEASLSDLASEDDDALFEATSLNIERLRRSELRASKRLAAAHTAHTEAKAGEERGRRRALYEAGLQADAEVERLAGEYGKRAAAVAETLHDIHQHAEVIRIANENRPDYTPWSDPHGLRIYEGVRLPAAAKSGASIWPLDLPQGRAWQPPSLTELPPPAPRADPVGQRTLEKGGRAFVMPACDFGRAAR